MSKVYCKNCKYSGWHAHLWCYKIIHPTLFNKYTNQIESESETISISNNNNGECRYYKPRLHHKLKIYLKTKIQKILSLMLKKG